MIIPRDVCLLGRLNCIVDVGLIWLYLFVVVKKPCTLSSISLKLFRYAQIIQELIRLTSMVSHDLLENFNEAVAVIVSLSSRLLVRTARIFHIFVLDSPDERSACASKSN